MVSNHPRARSLIDRGLFDDLASFTDLETRLADLADERQRLAAFALFAEAFLATRPLPRVTDVWSGEAAGPEVRRRFALSEEMPGGHGLFRLITGEVYPFWIHFSPGRSPLTKKTAQPFLELLEQRRQPLLFTNGDELPPFLLRRDGFHSVRGIDLDRLDRQRFQVMHRWMRGAGIMCQRELPPPHHARTLPHLRPLLEVGERATAVVAPGTAPELLALKVAEGVGSGRAVLILCQGTAQQRRLIHCWRRHGAWLALAALWLAGERGGGGDWPVVRTGELDVPSTNDVEIIRRFLTWRFTGVRVLFANYGALEPLARAMAGLPPLELGLFLEARETLNDPFALTDENLALRRRLFFSAVIQRHDPMVRQRGDGPRPVRSIDDETVYGPVVAVAPLAAARERGTIRPFKLIIPILAAGPVPEPPPEDEEGAAGQPGSESVEEPVAGPVADQSRAVALALTAGEARHILTWHANPAAARDFAQPAPTLAGPLAAYRRFYIAGNRNTAQRDRLLDRFRGERRAILANVRCLAEGLESPAVDMLVFFPAAKKSRLDTARALMPLLTRDRASEGEPGDGMVCLPLIVDDLEGDGFRTALENAEGFWRILQDLRELDENLDRAIRQARESMGRQGRADLTALAEHLSVVTDLPDREPLIEGLLMACIDRLGSEWDYWFGRLSAYHDHFGHGEVPDGWADDPELGDWVRRQRQDRGKGKLAPERIDRLEGLGFVWDPEAAAWERLFTALTHYRRQHGHCRVPAVWPENPALAVWVSEQRRLWKKNRLDDERHRRLDGLGFVWDLEKALWERQFAALKLFRQLHGHCKVPADWPQNPQLAAWVAAQRQAWKKNRLDAEHRLRLDALGFVWDLEAAHWQGMFDALARFRQLHGHCKVPDPWPQQPPLATWVTGQRREWKKGRLDPDRQRRLDELDFIWDLEAAHWQEMYTALERFKERHGHAKVPAVLPEEPHLGDWAKAQRREREREKLDPARQQRLDAIGFIWDLEAADWQEMFAALSRFQETHGHCEPAVDGPDGDPGLAELADWVTRQRRQYRMHRLQPERVERLNGLGFVWDPAVKFWDDMFEALVEFHRREGHFNVPRSGVEPAALSDWVRRQRREKKKGKGAYLTGERIERLQGIGFIWDEAEAAWEEMYRALAAFRAARNHCIVPDKWPENPRLARWVTTQRKLYRQRNLTEERIRRLEKLGFIWDAKTIYWEELFAALALYRDRYGNCLVPEGYIGHSDLAWWVAAQRKARLSGQLDPERIERLTALDFFWDQQEADWYTMYQALVRYHQRHGDALVPEGWPENPRLATWIGHQRQARQRGQLTPIRVARLDELGFIWDAKEVVVEEMLTELSRFKERFGHCNVPPQWSENTRLGLWMQFQRQAKKQGDLDPGREARLTALGVDWLWDGVEGPS